LLDFLIYGSHNKFIAIAYKIKKITNCITDGYTRRYIMKIGQAIVNIREQHEMTQEEFARIFSVTRQTVSNWENEKSYPDLQTLVNMSEKFEVSLDSMLKENVEMVKKMDRERKRIKYISRGLFALIGICIIAFGIWMAMWYNAKQECETKFQSGIEQYGFVWNEEDFQYWMEFRDDVTFVLERMDIMGWYEFSRACLNQGLICYIQQEDCLVKITWYGEQGMLMEASVYDREGEHHLSEMEVKKRIRDEQELQEMERKAKEMCAALYIDKYNVE